jgi:hypothetical protein
MYTNTSIQDTIKLGELTAKLTHLMSASPTAALRAGAAIEAEFAKLSGPTTLSSTLADAQATINRMGNDRQADASTIVAEAKAEWMRIVPTLSAVRLAQLKAEVGSAEVVLLARYKQQEAARLRGALG